MHECTVICVTWKFAFNRFFAKFSFPQTLRVFDKYPDDFLRDLSVYITYEEFPPHATCKFVPDDYVNSCKDLVISELYIWTVFDEQHF